MFNHNVLDVDQLIFQGLLKNFMYDRFQFNSSILLANILVVVYHIQYTPSIHKVVPSQMTLFIYVAS